MPSGTVVFESAPKALRLLTLNRPAKLNALDTTMVREVTAHVLATRDACASKRECVALIVRGAGDKAFCAGGDVAAVRASGLQEAKHSKNDNLEFFRDEYRMNGLLGSLGFAQSRVKQISVWDGIVMGGGVGLSAHGRFRVATERATFAMPETAIGLFPDVGACSLLARMPGRCGVYVGLTGARLKAADLVYAGLATHFVPTWRLDELFQRLSELDANAEPDSFDRDVDQALTLMSEPVGVSHVLEAKRVAIDACFGRPERFDDPHEPKVAVEDLFSRLKSPALYAGSHADFGANTLAALETASPTSLKVTLEAIKRAHPGDKRDLADCLKTDFRLVARLTDPALDPLPDFYEGVRAVLVDKDRTPAWRASLAEVSDADVARHFDPLDPADGVAELDFDGILPE